MRVIHIISDDNFVNFKLLVVSDMGSFEEIAKRRLLYMLLQGILLNLLDSKIMK